MNKVLIAPENWRRRLRDGLPNLQMKCPQCGQWGDILDHTVRLSTDEMGRVDLGFIEPSVICAEECGFHAMVALEKYHEEITGT